MSTNSDLEIDISDTELADIMPHVSPSYSLSPITTTGQSPKLADNSSSSVLTKSVINDSNTVEPVKKPRKPRVSKKIAEVNANDAAIENSEPSSATASPSTRKTKSTKTPTATKSSTVEQQFTLGLTKECFTPEELAINPLTHIFIENSRVTNNELIKYQAVKAGILDYKCYGKGCPTKDGNWRRRLGYLILVRNNNRDTDLRMTNLSMLCPNCYCQEKGVISFDKMKKEIVRTCTFCNAVLDTKYNSDKCGRCAWQIKNQINKSANMDRLSRAFGAEVDGLSASNMAILMGSSILDEQSGIGHMSGNADGTVGNKYSGSTIGLSSTARLVPRQNVNPKALCIENSIGLKRLFMELSEQS